MGVNAPDRYERFVVPEGLTKLVHVKDTKVEHAATFIIQREDHTVGNLIRMQLHRDPHVTFAGYKIPHPLEYRMLIKVQTDGHEVTLPTGEARTYEPVDALREALKALHGEMHDMQASFESALTRYKEGVAMGGEAVEVDGFMAYGREIPRTEAEEDPRAQQQQVA